jgi:TonB-linked SusC/RagA family outer membrane protein
MYMKNYHSFSFYRFFLVIACSILPAYGFSQSFASLAMAEREAISAPKQTLRPLREVLKDLEASYNVFFTYKNTTLAHKYASLAPLPGKNKPVLEDILSELLKPNQLQLEKMDNIYFIAPIGTKVNSKTSDEKLNENFGNNNSQFNDDKLTGGRVESEIKRAMDVTVTGKITGETGEGLPGVSVSVKGTSTGTVSDVNGAYSLTVPNETSVLVYSFIGYVTQEIPVGSRTKIDVALDPDVTSLSEVVVMGYGTQEKKEVTGAVSSVSSKEITQVATTGLDQALQGRMSGVQVTQNSGEPGGSVSIRIRGAGSLNGGNEPLYVVDGAYYGNLNSINPNDIERIDVLKDAASAAIYGSRGTNGVVIVTTKRGKTGKIMVNMDAYAGVQGRAKKIDLLNGPEFARLANNNLRNSNLPTNPEWDAPNQPTYDWQDALFQNAPIQNYNVAISGGNEKSRTYLSAGYFQQGGIVVGSDFQRFTARFNTDYDILKNLKVGASVNFGQEKRKAVDTESNFSGALLNTAQMMPTQPIYASQEGPISNILYGWEGYALKTAAINVNFYPKGINNPVHIADKYFEMPRNRINFLASAFGEYEIIKGLKFRSTINLTFGTRFDTYKQQDAPDPISDVGQYRQFTGYNENWDRGGSWNWINTLSYSRTIAKHTFMVLAGTDALKSSYRYADINTQGIPADQTSIRASDREKRNTDGFPSDESLVSYIGRITYDYAGKYLLTANIRRDGSSKFGPKNKYGTFPSVSLGWRISEEQFLKPLAFLDDLKLRASYGVVGNQNIPNFSYFNSYQNDGGRYQYTLGPNQSIVPALFTTPGDSSIHWEESVQTNFGVDASLWRGRITFTADYYVKKIRDMLGYVPVPVYAGVRGDNVLQNAFSMQNTGIELALGFNQRIGEVNFSANVNFSTLNNKLTKLTGSEKSYVSQSISAANGGAINDDNAQTRSQVGERIANFWGYVTDGIFQDQEAIQAANAIDGDPKTEFMGGVAPGDRRFKDLNNDGKITAEDKTILGNGLPQYIYGINLKGEYKGIDLSVFFTGQADVDIANMSKFFLYNMRYYNSTGIVNGSKDLLNSWTGPGTSNDMPRNAYNAPTSNRYFSSYYIEKGDFFRLRNIQLGYTLPKTWLDKARISNIRVYMSAQNPFTLTKYSGYDPEVGSANVGGGRSPLTTGVDYGRYPVSRIFMGGINFQF